uniref:thioredoxin-like isoform X1 n=1 Tax=Pristiophorus japonicus TaxID=55135 RepID=UPI00398EA451
MVHMITDKEEFNAKLKEAGDKLVVVDFFATWCGPCKVIAPDFKKLSEDYTNIVIFFKVDVDEAQEVAEQCGIDCMPTFIFYKNGKEIHKIAGANLDQLQSKVKELQ